MGNIEKRVEVLKKVALNTINQDVKKIGETRWSEMQVANAVVSAIRKSDYESLVSEGAYLAGIMHGKRIERIKQKKNNKNNQAVGSSLNAAVKVIEELEAENKRLKFENNHLAFELKYLEDNLMDIKCSFTDWEKTLMIFEGWMMNSYAGIDREKALTLMSDWDCQSSLFMLFFNNFCEKNKLLSEVTNHLENVNLQMN